MAKAYLLPVEIEPLADGTGYLASCEEIQGCLAEGASVAEAIDNLEDVARILLELRVTDGLGIPDHLQEAPEGALHVQAQILISVG
ncbi:MAG: hypothetical protein HW416_3186 [Chloroflexi bacterium]|nr:hypothetical protein [Chloroflexota bacterium]